MKEKTNFLNAFHNHTHKQRKWKRKENDSRKDKKRSSYIRKKKQK